MELMQNIITKQIDIFLAQQISIITVLINDYSNKTNDHEENILLLSHTYCTENVRDKNKHHRRKFIFIWKGHSNGKNIFL